MPTQTTDILNPVGTALTFQFGELQWIIAAGVSVRSEALSGAGVLDVQNGSTLINNGAVSSKSYFGALFGAIGAQDMTIENNAAGTIVGTTGVLMGGTGSADMTVKNNGLIEGTSQVGVSANDVSGFKLINTGEVVGASTAVSVSWQAGGPGGGAKIVNKGLIHSPLEGISIGGNDPAQTTRIVNKKNGMIEGGNGTSVFSGVDAGAVGLTNKGTLKGSVILTADAKDTVVNQGKIKGVVQLRDGKDYYENDEGKAGRVSSGDGNDKLVAGKSKDMFVFDADLDSANNVDRVKKFESGKDEFFLKDNVFLALTSPGPLDPDMDLKKSEFRKSKKAKDADDHILYHRKSGALYYDENGSDPGGRVQFAQLDPGQSLKASDFTVIA